MDKYQGLDSCTPLRKDMARLSLDSPFARSQPFSIPRPLFDEESRDSGFGSPGSPQVFADSCVTVTESLVVRHRGPRKELFTSKRSREETEEIIDGGYANKRPKSLEEKHFPISFLDSLSEHGDVEQLSCTNPSNQQHLDVLESQSDADNSYIITSQCHDLLNTMTSHNNVHHSSTTTLQKHVQHLDTMTSQNDPQHLNTMTSYNQTQHIDTMTSHNHAQYLDTMTPQKHARQLDTMTSENHPQYLNTMTSHNQAQHLDTMTSQNQAQYLDTMTSQNQAQHLDTMTSHVQSLGDRSREVKTAVEILEQEQELIGDGSRKHVLPTTAGKKADLKYVTAHTLSQLMEGKYDEDISHFQIIDCRYPYEFNGGHIEGAKNIYTETEINSLLTTKEQRVTGNQVVVFHCEFSSERGPKMLRHLRAGDRKENCDVYPSLYYPEIYIMQGGYKAFYENHLDKCQPMKYTPMLDKSHSNELRHFRSRSKSWTAGEGQIKKPVRKFLL